MKKYRNALIAAGMCGVFLMMNFNAWKNFNEKKRYVKDKIKEIETQISVSEEIHSVEEEYKNIKSALIDDVFKFKRLIENAAHEDGIDINSFKSVAQSNDEGDFSERGVVLVLKCTYINLKHFLNTIESNPMVRVKKMRITGGEEDDLNVTLTVTGLVRGEK